MPHCKTFCLYISHVSRVEWNVSGLIHAANVQVALPSTVALSPNHEARINCSTTSLPKGIYKGFYELPKHSFGEPRDYQNDHKR